MQFSSSMPPPRRSVSLDAATTATEATRDNSSSRNLPSNNSTDCQSPSPMQSKSRRRRISRWVIQEVREVCDDQVCTQEVKALPQIEFESILVQGILGEGGFSTVYQVKVNNKERPSSASPSLAMKQLKLNRRSKKLEDEEDCVMAIHDLCNEVALLAKIKGHENIVSIEGVCSQSVSQAYSTGLDYFFLMERLSKTLADQLKIWRQQSSYYGRLLGLGGRHHSLSSLPEANAREQQPRLFSSAAIYQRLQGVALGIAKGMCRLHSPELEIVVRDLKPQNIGFDAQTGCVKIFDLGMARPIHETDTAEVAGTFRYMSPEVVVGQRLGLEADVYSFGIILYELVTLQKPFDQYFSKGKLVRKSAFFEHVVSGRWRPSLDKIPCRATRRLIDKCWDPAPRQRPSFPRIYLLLTQIIKNNNDVEGASRFRKELLVEKDVKAPTVPTTDNVKPALKPLSSPVSSPSETTRKASTNRKKSFFDAFRVLRPLSKVSSRGASDVTAEITATARSDDILCSE